MTNELLLEGKYKIIRILGKGGMGTVYLAENIKLGSLWAIKELVKETFTKFDLYAESNILKRLSHPALPRIFDILEDEKAFYIIVDFIDGESLDKALDRGEKFPEKIVMEWAKQLCGVLKYLHEFKPNPIIYRDMKPSNIILTSEGLIKLIDFGIAREYKFESGNDTVYIGTRGYAAPEQYGLGQTNATTDIFSLGVTLLHFITGQSPLALNSTLEEAYLFNELISENNRFILGKCIKHNPYDRYQTADEMLEAIKRAEINEMNGSQQLGVLEANGKIENMDQSKREINIGGLNSRIISFKKIVLAVWGNTEFACEFAYIAAKRTCFDVLLMDMDFISPKASYYLNFPQDNKDGFKPTDFDDILQASKSNRISNKALMESSFAIGGMKNLRILTNSHSIDNYEKYKYIKTEELIEIAYRTFDITIIAVNKSILDEVTIKALDKADYSIVATAASADCIGEFEDYIYHLNKKFGITPEKVRYVAYEYRAGINPVLSDIKNKIGTEHYAGCVSYDPNREIYRNMQSAFAKRMSAKGINEYLAILERFSIIPKRTLKSRISELFKKTRIKSEKGEINEKG
jgi:serine/threonine protein kinase